MSNKLKISFWTILVLIIINCGTVLASEITIEKVEEIIKEFNSSWVLNQNQLEKFDECLSTYNYMSFTSNTYYGYLFFIFYDNVPNIKTNNHVEFSDCRVLRLEKSREEAIWDYEYSSIDYGFLNSDKWYTESGFYEQNTLDYKVGYEPGATNMNIDFSTYSKPYFEITLDYKGESSIQANGEKVKAYTYDSIYDTGITTIGNKFLKLGYLYIDDNYTISNLLTSVPIMTKYSMNLLNNWQYTLYEGVYTTGEKENGYLKCEIRIPIQYVSTPNYYNIFFKSKDTEIQEDINIDFVLLNNTENSGTIGPIITPSGDIISGDAIKDETTLGDINNTINNLENKLENVILGTENESGDRVGGLLGGLLDGIKGFFIPEDDYFSNYFTELNDWFSARLGLLYFPFDLLFEFFDRVTSIDFNDQTLSIGPYKMPLNDDFELVPKLEFDFKTFVENEDIKGVYDTYLIIVDGLIIFGLSQLIRIKYEEVFGK